MMWKFVAMLTCIVVAAACSKPGDSEPAAPMPPTPAVPLATQQEQPVQTGIERPPIDLGDVDSGVFIHGTLAPVSESATATAEYIENMRGILSLTTISVTEPFPEKLFVRFELIARRNFAEQPVVVRAKAYREEDEIIGDEYAVVLGSVAALTPVDENGLARPRAFVVNVLEGLDAIPDSMLVHGRADAWLMPKGTTETVLDPRTAESSERIALIGNPVRINFIRADADQ